MALTDYPFTPSEYLLLNADQFVQEASASDRFTLLLSDGYVSGKALASLLITAAILANEEEGALQIEVRESKGFFMRSHSSNVYIKPVGFPPNWNTYTLESAVLYASGQLYSTQQENTIYNTVYTLLREDSKDPWAKIADLVEWGLASSNWLIPVEGDAAAAFSIPFICPGKVRDLVLDQPIRIYRELLASVQENQPPLWKLMQGEISRALTDRKGK